MIGISQCLWPVATKKEERDDGRRRKNRGAGGKQKRRQRALSLVCDTKMVRAGSEMARQGVIAKKEEARWQREERIEAKEKVEERRKERRQNKEGVSRSIFCSYAFFPFSSCCSFSFSILGRLQRFARKGYSKEKTPRQSGRNIIGGNMRQEERRKKRRKKQRKEKEESIEERGKQKREEKKERKQESKKEERINIQGVSRDIFCSFFFYVLSSPSFFFSLVQPQHRAQKEICRRENITPILQKHIWRKYDGARQKREKKRRRKKKLKAGR